MIYIVIETTWADDGEYMERPVMAYKSVDKANDEVERLRDLNSSCESVCDYTYHVVQCLFEK